MKFRILISCLLIVNVLVGCTRGEKKVENPNVLLISIDTLRKDHLGIYGYERSTSPNIDKLAKQGVVFDNMISTSSWTLPAHTSMLTGKYPAFHGLQDDGVKLSSNIPTLAEYYKKREYYTMAVISHVYVSSEFGLERGFDVFDDSLINRGARNPIAEEVVDNFISLVEKMPTKRFFGFIHFFDPHFDYTAPPPFYTKFTDPSYKGDIDGSYESVSKYNSKRNMPESDRQQLIDNYDGEIAYVDSQIGRLLKELKRRGMLDNTVIVITSDHGEEFKDHGLLGHGKSLFREQLNVPLIITGYPGATPGSRRSELVSSIDLMPTLLDLIGEDDLQDFQGQPIFSDKGISSRSVISESIRFGYEMRAIRQGQYKLINYLFNNRWLYFDLFADPLETKPIPLDPTGKNLRSILADYSSTVDSGWHLKLIAKDGSFRFKATIETSGRFVNPHHFFSQNIDNLFANVTSFELTPDRKRLTFDVYIANHIGEIIFNTEPPDAAVTYKVKVINMDEASGIFTDTSKIKDKEKEPGIFLGTGIRVPDGKAISLTRSDPRVEGMPRNYMKTAPGLYIRSVRSMAESAPKTKLTDQAIERLRSLGYIQ